MKDFFPKKEDGGIRVKRIHFNFPHNAGIEEKKGSQNDVQELVENFFKSTNQVQLPKDRIHMALPESDSINTQKATLGLFYKVFDSAKNSGYKVYKKRLFNDESKAEKNRYKGYKHVVNKGVSLDEKKKNVGIKGREYIFEKIDTTKKDIDSFYKKCTYENKEYYYPKNQKEEAEDPKTDNDSSSYEEEDDSFNLVMDNLNIDQEKEQKEPAEQNNQKEKEEKKSDE